MFSKLFALFALFAMALAAPKPAPAPAPAPAPQYLTYSAGIDYAYPAAAGVAPVLSPYASPLAYSAYPAAYAYYR